MRNTLILLVSLFILYCCSPGDISNQRISVSYKGALKSIMHKGDISSKINLKEFENKDNFYAIGAVEKLKGEIIILNGKPFISQVKNGEQIVEESFDFKATLLVFSTVENWLSISLPDSIESYEVLESAIESLAYKYAIDTDNAFPFLLKGNFKFCSWHVIDWDDNDKEHTHQKHIESGINKTSSDVEGEILGFYSKKHHAIFTHHTTNMHMHIKSDDNTICGHVDDLNPGKGISLFIPLI